MGLKCSLFGHAFDERDVVRERDSTGSEVVTIVKDVERCAECGTTRVVSTNKEVVSAAGATADGGVEAGATLRTPGDDGSAGDAFEAPDEPEAGAATVTEPSDAGEGAGLDAADDVEGEDATVLTGGSDDEADPDGTTVLGDAAEGTADVAGPESEPTDADHDPATADEPVTDDAEILTDDEPADRAPGRWPGEEAPDAWEPEPLGDDADDALADEGSTADAEADTDADDETPDATAEPAPDVEPEPAATASFTVPDGHYRCPECSHTIPASSSFRRGDACPECVRGYLEAGE
jgi:hypothetical protein